MMSLKTLAEAAGDGGFAVAGRAVEEHGAAGVERGAALLDEVSSKVRSPMALRMRSKVTTSLVSFCMLTRSVNSSRATGAGPV